MPTPNDATPEHLDEGPYAGKTIAEVIHDYAVIRGDLSDPDARAQLVRLIERRIAAARRGMTDATGEEDALPATLPDLPAGYRFRIGDLGWSIEVILEHRHRWYPWERIGSEPIRVDERPIEVRIAEAAQKVWRPVETYLSERNRMQDYLASRGLRAGHRARRDRKRSDS